MKSKFLLIEASPQVVSEAKDNFRKDDDVRWQFGVPPKGNANFAWVQHFIHHLAPHGMAGFVLAKGSMSSNRLFAWSGCIISRWKWIPAGGETLGLHRAKTAQARARRDSSKARRWC